MYPSRQFALGSELGQHDHTIPRSPGVSLIEVFDAIRCNAQSRAFLLGIALPASLLAWQATAETHLGKGYEALRHDRYDEAATEFRAALQIDPTLVMRARFPLAVALFERKDTAAARREFETVRRELGNSPNVAYYLGRLDLLDQNFAARSGI